MVETPNFHEFNIVVETREQLIHSVKSIAARIGFKAIIPFSDRNNRQTATSYFCCSLSGVSSKRTSTNCPFKLTYTKSIQDPFYRLQQDHTSHHNHKLPISEYAAGGPHGEFGRANDNNAHMSDQEKTA